uniref:Xaa-Pro dipeptidase n=1 Tax=Spongospora subterranea TaxID=70186 RepID=A0A0H5QH61_9EUKA|eukprot:CRZ00987.1 hypothetical protein [Spongospora subterranea]
MELGLPEDIDLIALHRENRNRVFDGFPNAKGEIALFQGGKKFLRYDTDHEDLFRQESFFFYLFGVNEPGLYGALDLAQRKSYLFIHKPTLDHEIWCGKAKTLEEFSRIYGIDYVRYTSEIAAVLNELNVTNVHVLEGVNHDSGSAIERLSFEGDGAFKFDGRVLLDIMSESRVIKTHLELALLQHVNNISSKAHIQVMQNCRPGMFEFQLESSFIHFSSFHGGSRYQAYTCICGTGANGAVLHYGHAGAPNDRRLEPDDMCLLDMGAEYHCYASDITCSYPANGRFTDSQRAVYNIVYDAQRAVEAAVRPGVEWSEMHKLAERVICQGLMDNDFIFGDSVDQLTDLHIPSLFFPHGLGHFIGLDTHDVGGFPKGRKRLEGPGLSCLRINRVLKANMVLSNEPGVYFIEALLRPAFSNDQLKSHLNIAKIEQFMAFGGIRLEDDLIITETGCINMTRVPRKCSDIESVMAGQPFHHH